MLYIMAHSLSRFCQGLRPVAISKTTHPRDQISAADEYRVVPPAEAIDDADEDRDPGVGGV